jgi:hypothetical protein
MKKRSRETALLQNTSLITAGRAVDQDHRSSLACHSVGRTPQSMSSPSRTQARSSSARKSSGAITACSETPREVTTLKLRDEWVRLAAVQKLSPILRVVGVRLAHFYNGKTGQLNPSYALLAAECDTTERTAQKAVAAFRKLGMIADTRSSGGRQDATNEFTLIIPYRRVFTRTPVRSKSVAPRGVRAGIRRVSSSVFEGCPPGHPNSVRENSVRNSERGFAARSADDARESIVSNSPKTADDASRNPAFTTADDAAIPEPLTPIPRAAGAARIEPLAEPDQPPPCRASPEMGRPRERARRAQAVDEAMAAFERVKLDYPPHRIGNDAEDYPAFCAALAARGHVSIVIEAVKNLMWESGADVPCLAEALSRIEHGE